MITKSYLLFLVFLVSSFTCDSPRKERLTDMPTRDELMSAFRESRKILIVYGSMNPDMTAAYAALAKKIKIRARFASFEVKPCAEVTPEDLQTKAIVLIGTSASNSVLKKMIHLLPLHFTTDAIHFDNKNYKDASTVALLSFYPNPLFPKLPVSVLSATNDEAIRQFLANKTEEGWRLFSFSAWNYEIYKNEKRQVLGMFNANDWSLDKKVHFDFSDSETPVQQTKHFRFFIQKKSPNFIDVQDFIKKVEQSTVQIRLFVDSTKNLPLIQYQLYASAEEKGLITNNTSVSSIDFETQEVHSVWNDLYKKRNLGKENQLLLRCLLGKPKTPVLEQGLATYFVKDWQIKGYDYWAMRIFTSDNMIALPALLDSAALDQDCNLMTTCLSASFVEFLIQKEGKSAFLQMYKNWIPSTLEIKQLEQEWHTWLKEKAVHFKPQSWANKKLPYLKGFNFTHEGYGIFNGYISNLASQAIDKQANDLNCNTVSLIPYTFMANPQKPSFLPIANSAGDENDEGLVHATFQARQQGMTVVLKPQIWIGRGSWPGDVSMTSEADWQQFNNFYYRWIIHYALLAEMYEMDVLCIGTEFSKATLAREQDWRELIHKIRGLYAGKLTYAANWGEEFEKVSFWDDLDFIGFNCYYPWSLNKEPTREELNAGFSKILSKAENVQKRFNKPLVFTEIGFKSIKMPWLIPHEASNDTPYFGEHQKLCYEIVLENIQNKPWIQGILWWKFPSYIDFQGIENDDFTPNRKPAELVVKQWFAKMP